VYTFYNSHHIKVLIAKYALDMQERVSGTEDRDTLVPVDRLIGALLENGRFDEDSDTLITLSNLALQLQQMGDYNNAEPLYQRALEAKERTLGVEHPSTIHTVHDFASLKYDQGDLDGAERLFWQVLKAQERTLGPRHEDTLDSVANLAVVLKDKGKLSVAEPLSASAGREEAATRSRTQEYPPVDS
jgi:tetratricopeptide (TPR) repeat protein